MAGFTDEEVATSVDRFLLKQVSMSQLKTGARDILALQAQVYDLLTTALLLRPDTYFYITYLARNRLLALVNEQLSLINEIIAAAPNTTRPAKRIRSTTDLATAQAALLDLNAGLNARRTGVRGSIGPAVDRFRKSIATFVGTELAKNVVVAGQVTETGPELRQDIAAAWAEATQKHPEILRMVSNFSRALASLESVRLPESSIRGIVSRIQDRLDEVKETLEGAAAIEESRGAMLDLLTMRTLLTKASTFRNPELVLMPKTRDATVVSFVDSEGVEASITGVFSGPFNYDPGTTLDLSVNGGTTVSVVLPQALKGSRAELRTKSMSPWVPPTLADQVALEVDFGAVAALFLIGYADGPSAATAMNAALSLSGVEVSWDAATSQLVFQSMNSGDASHLRLLTDTSARQSFRSWAFPPTEVAFLENKGEPVAADQIAAAIGAASPLVSAAVVEENLFSFTAERTSVGGEEAVLWDRRDAGADLVSTGAAVVVSPSRNFGTIGIRPGMALHTTSPDVSDYEIVEVSGPALTLSPAPPTGTLTYYIGPDYRSVPDGARVRVTSGADRDNTGFYRAAAGGGQVARLVVDRSLRSPDSQLAVTVFRHLVSIAASGTTVSSGVGVLASSAGATALGLAVTASEQRPLLTRLQLGAGDFLLRGVRSGDLLTLTSPSAVVYSDVVIDSVTTTSIFIVQENVVFEPGNWTYEIRSARAAAFVTARSGVDAFVLTPYAQDFTSIDALVGRLIRGARYTGAIEAGLVGYAASLENLRDTLIAYTVPRERTIDNAVQTLREQGLDRALDLLLTLEIEELFTMEPDGVSYSTWLVRKAATVGREVVPVSKFARSDRIVQEWRPVSFQADPFDPRGEDTQR